MSTEQPAPAWTQLPEKLPHLAFKDRLPVKTLQAIPGNGFDLPGRISSSSLTTTPIERRKADHHTIEWVPAMRHFVVLFFQASERKVHVRYIHESNVRQWEPAAA